MQPIFLEGEPEDSPQLIHFLRLVLAKEMMRRSRLPAVNTVEHVVKLLKESKNIIVLTGAGVCISFSGSKTAF